MQASEVHEDGMQVNEMQEENSSDVEQESFDVSEDPAVTSARAKMEHRAAYLLRQVELIETANKEYRLQVEKFDAAENDSNSYLTEAIPPGLLALSYSDLDSSESMEEAPVGTPENHRPALADDLNSCDASRGDYDRRLKELEAENRSLREMVKKSCKAVLNIQANADLKIVRLEVEVAHLRQQLADEFAANSKFMVLNQSLRKQLNCAASDIIQKKHGNLEDKQRYYEFLQLHQREVTVEKHLNGLIASRNLAIKESTALKKLLLATCYECRQRLPLRRKNPDEAKAPAKPAPARPTYQSSARQLVQKDLPTQRTDPQLLYRHSSHPTLQKMPAKSCLKTSVSNGKISPTSGTRISPTSTTELLSLSQDGLNLPSQPESHEASTQNVCLKQERNLMTMMMADDSNTSADTTTGSNASSESDQRLNPIRGFRRFARDAKKPRPDRRVDRSSSSSERSQETRKFTAPQSSEFRAPGAAQNKADAVESLSTKASKEKPHWKRRSGAFFGANNKHELERIDC